MDQRISVWWGQSFPFHQKDTKLFVHGLPLIWLGLLLESSMSTSTPLKKRICCVQILHQTVCKFGQFHTVCLVISWVPACKIKTFIMDNDKRRYENLLMYTGLNSFGLWHPMSTGVNLFHCLWECIHVSRRPCKTYNFFVLILKCETAVNIFGKLFILTKKHIKSNFPVW